MTSWSRGLFIPVILLLLIAFFQNCEVVSLNSFSSGGSSNSDQLNSSISGGNGGGYDGKIGNSFYHFVPSFQCLNQKAQFYSKIIVEGQTTSFIDQSSCEKQASEISTKDLQFSLYDSTLVGYRNELFLYSSSETAPDQNTYVEIWCFDQSDLQREVVFKYNSQTKISSGVLYQKGTPAESLGQLSRYVTNTTAIFKGNNSELIIDKNIKDSQSLFLTKLQISETTKQSKTLQLSCRLGGYLDATIWPAKNRGNGSEIIFTKNKDIAFQIQSNSKDNNYFSNHIVQINLENSESKALTNKSVGHYGVKKIKLSSDEKYLLYLSDRPDHPFVFNLYALSLKDNLVTQLSQNIERFEQSVFDYKILLNSEFVFYTDTSYFDPITATYQLTLKKVSLSGDHPVETISDHTTHFAPGQRIIIPSYGSHFFNKTTETAFPTIENTLYYFQISDKIVMSYDLWKYDLRTMKKTLLFQSTPDKMITISSLLFPHSEVNQLFLVVYNSLYQAQVISINNQGMSQFVSSTLLATTFNQVTNQWLALNDYNSFSQFGSMSVYDKNLNLVKEISFTHALSINSSSQNIFFINSQEKLMSYELLLNTEKALCPELDFIKNFTVTNTNEIYFLRYFQNETQIFIMNSNQTCKLVNKIPMKFKTDGTLTLSSSKNSLILNVGSFLSNSPAEAIIWIPLNGLSPVRIDTSETPANWWSGFFNSQSNKIYYFGYDRNFSESALFQWQLPL